MCSSAHAVAIVPAVLRDEISGVQAFAMNGLVAPFLAFLSAQCSHFNTAVSLNLRAVFPDLDEDARRKKLRETLALVGIGSNCFGLNVLVPFSNDDVSFASASQCVLLDLHRLT